MAENDCFNPCLQRIAELLFSIVMIYSCGDGKEESQRSNYIAFAKTCSILKTHDVLLEGFIANIVRGRCLGFCISATRFILIVAIFVKIVNMGAGKFDLLHIPIISTNIPTYHTFSTYPKSDEMKDAFYCTLI